MEMEGVGHLVPLERPEGCAEVIGGWVDGEMRRWWKDREKQRAWGAMGWRGRGRGRADG